MCVWRFGRPARYLHNGHRGATREEGSRGAAHDAWRIAMMGWLGPADEIDRACCLTLSLQLHTHLPPPRRSSKRPLLARDGEDGAASQRDGQRLCVDRLTRALAASPLVLVFLFGGRASVALLAKAAAGAAAADMPIHDHTTRHTPPHPSQSPHPTHTQPTYRRRRSSHD